VNQTLETHFKKEFFLHKDLQESVVVADTTALMPLLKMANGKRSTNMATEPKLKPSKH